MDHTRQGYGTENRKESIAIKSHKMVVTKTNTVTVEMMRYILIVALLINRIH